MQVDLVPGLSSLVDHDAHTIDDSMISYDSPLEVSEANLEGEKSNHTTVIRKQKYSIFNNPGTPETYGNTQKYELARTIVEAGSISFVLLRQVRRLIQFGSVQTWLNLHLSRTVAISDSRASTSNIPLFLRLISSPTPRVPSSLVDQPLFF